MSYPNRRRSGAASLQFAALEDVDPAAELVEDREVPDRGDRPGGIEPAPIMPDQLQPWAELTDAIVHSIDAGIERVVADVLALDRPAPLVRFLEVSADAAGEAVAAVEYVPPGATWEIGHLHVSHGAAAAINVSVYHDTAAAGYRRVDAASVPTLIGASFNWTGFHLGGGHRLEVVAAGLAAGQSLTVGVFGLIHSTP